MGITWVFNPFTSEFDATIEAELVTLSWRHSVLDKDITDPSLLSPIVGDRYLIGLNPAAGVAVGAWAGKDGQITEYKAIGWTFDVPQTGWVVAVEDEQDRFYYFGGSTWDAKLFESTTASTGLEKVGLDIRVNFETSNPTLKVVGSNELGIKYGNGFGQDANGLILVPDTTGGANLATVVDINANGIAIKIDDSTIKENGSNRLYVDPTAVDHDQLLNFVANEHIDHTSVTLTAGEGISGGGDISSNRSFALDINGITNSTATLGANDLFAIYDATTDTRIEKVTFSNLNGQLDHDALTNYVANEHIDHTAVSIDSGEGISGGGDISSTRTLALDFNGMTNSSTTMGANDVLAFYDATTDTRMEKITFSNFNGQLDHDSLNNFVANEHIDHSAVNITTTAGSSGLTGGGDLTATRSLSVDINGTNDKAAPVINDEIILADSEDSNNLKKADIGSLPFSIVSSGDINETSFSVANNQVAPANVTGLAFANGTVRSAKVHYSIVIDATADLFETGTIYAIQRGSDWVISQSETGDDSLVVFSITNAGQIQYTSANYSGFVSGTMKFRAQTTSV
jgi:hypothetical protein